MKTILVDDEILAMEQFELECEEISEIEVVGKFNSAQDALTYAEKNRVDFALLDIAMPKMNGLELAQKLKELYPKMVLVFVTAYSEFYLDALKLKADFYLLKPYNFEDVADVLERAQLLVRRQKKRIKIRTFGRFDVFVDEVLITFPNPKAKELLAICVDNQGGNVPMEMAIDRLWEERIYDSAVKQRYRTTVMNLNQTLMKFNAGELLVRNRGACSIKKELADCDYFDFTEGKKEAIQSFQGEYMYQYSWAEEKAVLLTRQKNKNTI